MCTLIKIDDRMKGVRRWGKHLYIYGDDDREVTHLCLDGGKLSVPFKSVPFLHKKIGADISKGIRNYLVERRTPVFKFHADLDIFEPTIKPYIDILAWIKDDMLNVLRQFYPQLVTSNFKELTVLVCTTEAKTGVEKYGTTYDKVGVHLLFPWLLTDTDSSMMLRSAFIQYFISKYQERQDGYNEWADVFDKTVYVSNGLRMVGCGKMERCKACKGQYNDSGGCSDGLCGGKGKYDVGRVYKIQTVLNGDGTQNDELLEELLEDEICMTNVCSIRCNPEIVKEEHMPKQTYPEWFDKTKDFEPKRGMNSGTETNRSKKVVRVK